MGARPWRARAGDCEGSRHQSWCSGLGEADMGCECQSRPGPVGLLKGSEWAKGEDSAGRVGVLGWPMRGRPGGRVG